MEFRTMQNYLAVVREGTISAAAEALHVAQPSLSRQMRDLERELGVTLFVRGNRRITLTEEGMVLRKRAEEMVRLMQRTEEEVAQIKNHMSGTVRIGAGESRSFHYLSRTASAIAAEHPNVTFRLTSGDTLDLIDELNNGLLDFAVIFTEVDHEIYQSLQLPAEDGFGLLMPRDCPLAAKKEIRIDELNGLPLIVSRSSEPYFTAAKELPGLRIVATYNLLYNASLLVEDGLGYALCFDGLINTTGESPLCVRPVVPQIRVPGHLIWKKYQPLSPVVQLFLEQITWQVSRQR